MKTTLALLVCTSGLLAIGCGHFSDHAQLAWLDSNYAPSHQGMFPNHDNVKVLLEQPVKSRPQVYLNSAEPTRHYVPIAIMSITGDLAEEPRAIQTFVDFGAHAGADLVLIQRASLGAHVSYQRQVTSTAGSALTGNATNNLGVAAGVDASSAATRDDTVSVLQPNDTCIYRGSLGMWSNTIVK